nr:MULTISPECIES: flocculation-associated PEP-CTERM protein PepA [Halorhodospira]
MEKINPAKTLGSVLVVASIGVTGSVDAGAFTSESWTIDDSRLGLTNDPVGEQQVDRLSGSYNELLTLRGDGSFEATAWWNAAQFRLAGSGVPDNLAESPDPRSDSRYGLYGTLESTGQFDPGNGAFLGETGRITLWLDPNLDTEFSFANWDPSSETGDAANGLDLSGTGEDIKIGSADVLKRGSGSFDPDAGEDDIGSFALLFGDWELTEDGQEYFVGPDPFWMDFRVSGQFDFIQSFIGGLDELDPEQSATFEVTGSADGRFGQTTAIPEPGVLGLFGLGLLALGFVTRVRQQRSGAADA